MEVQKSAEVGCGEQTRQLNTNTIMKKGREGEGCFETQNEFGALISLTTPRRLNQFHVTEEEYMGKPVDTQRASMGVKGNTSHRTVRMSTIALIGYGE